MFKHIRSFVGKFFDENQQMWVVMYLSEFFWFLSNYFLAVEIKYPEEFLTNWSIIKHYSSQDKERNFTVYQMIKVHNEIFKGRKTNLIEFGVDRGGTLTTISNFAKDESRIYALDSFGFFADDIKNNVTGRNIDAPATNLVHDLKMRGMQNQDKLNYELNIGSRKFKCTTIPIYRDGYGLVGAICINVDYHYINEEVRRDEKKLNSFINSICKTDMILDENILSEDEYKKALAGKRHFRDF